MKVRRTSAGVAGLLLGMILAVGGVSSASAAGIEGRDYLIPAGEEIPSTNGARAWVSDCKVNDAAGTFPLQSAEGDIQGRYYHCQVGFVIEDGHQPGAIYTVRGEDVAATTTFQALGVPFVPSGGVECEPGALLPSYAGARGGGGEIGFPGEIGDGEFAAGLTIGFQDATCNPVRTAEPEPVEEPTPNEEDPVVIPEPTEEPVVPVPAERSVPVIGTCGYIPLPSGLDANQVSNVMASATPIPVVSEGVKVTAYVTQSSLTPDGGFEQNQIDLFVIPELPYDEISVQGKTWWTNGEAPQLDELFRSRTYTIDLDALVATPEMVSVGATGLAFTEEGVAPGVSVSIGDRLEVSSTLLQSFGIQSGNQERPLVNLLIAPMPLPAACDVPPPTVVVEEPDQDDAPRTVPVAVQTGIGPAEASGLSPASALGLISLALSLSFLVLARVRRRAGALTD